MFAIAGSFSTYGLLSELVAWQILTCLSFVRARGRHDRGNRGERARQEAEARERGAELAARGVAAFPRREASNVL